MSTWAPAHAREVPRLVLTLVSDRRRLAGRDLASLAHQAALAGVDQIQVREKDMGGRALRDVVAAVVAAVAGTAARVIVNGRADVARVTGAHGIQLPEEGLPVDAVRVAFPDLLVGVSCHSVAAARRAEEAGADFIVLGPIFPTPGKEDRTLGLAPLEETARGLRVPVHAIGGIDARTARLAVAAGARGLAAIRAFLEGPMDQAVRALRGC